MDRGIVMQHGLVTVEVALITPLMLVLMLSIAELGRALYQYNTLAKAVRDGARYMSTNTRLLTGIIDINNCTDSHNNTACTTNTKNLVVYGTVNAATATPLLPGLSTGNVTVTTVGTDDIKVTATYTYQPMFLSIPVDLVGGSSQSTAFTFTSYSEMMAL